MAQSYLDVRVDSRIELLAVVQYLSGYKLITQKDSLYRRNINQHFSRFKSHPAVKLFAEMSEDFNYDAPPTTMLHLSEPPDLHLQSPFTEHLEQRAGGRERLNQFINLLREFASETQFMAFFEASQPIFSPTVTRVHKQVQTCDTIRTMEEYFGLRQHSYGVLLAPLFANSNYGPRIERADRTYDAYAIVGTSEMAIHGILLFAFGPVVSCSLLWHEFGHSFVNPITAKFREEFDRYQALYVPISKRMARLAYPTWDICVNEHIVRAVIIRLTCRKHSNVRRFNLLMEKMRGFWYVEELCARLEDYEVHRDTYPTFEDFYPRLIDVFRQRSEGGLG